MTAPTKLVYPETPAARTRWIRDRRSPVPRPTETSTPQTLLETEIGPKGNLLHTGIIFLINRECPWTCVMCDLWQNTTLLPLPSGHAVEQLQSSLARLEKESDRPIQQIKIYNSGSFFDSKSIYPEDYPLMAEVLAPYERVIVECHPKLIGHHVNEFNRLLDASFEIAMGLEIACDQTLEKLNKRFTLKDYSRTCQQLNQSSIQHRSFIMVAPPFVSGAKARSLCHQTSMFAFEQGASCISLIPTRATTGAMKAIQQADLFQPPSLSLLEDCFDDALSLKSGRVFVDLWDVEHTVSCESCFLDRKNRLADMNQLQKILPRIKCEKCH